MLQIFIKGFVIGLLVSCPMGPINILVIQRTLNRGRWNGFVTGMGAMLSDFTYALLMMFAMQSVSEFIEQYKQQVQLVGCILLFLFGGMLLLEERIRNSGEQNDLQQDKSIVAITERGILINDFLSSFLLTLSNVSIIFAYIALYASFSFEPYSKGTVGILIGFGAFLLGCCFWWGLLTLIVSRLKHKFKKSNYKILNKVVGYIFIGFAIYGLIRTLV